MSPATNLAGRGTVFTDDGFVWWVEFSEPGWGDDACGPSVVGLGGSGTVEGQARERIEHETAFVEGYLNGSGKA